MKKIIIYTIVLILVACTVPKPAGYDSMPGVSIPFNEMNTSIILHESQDMLDIYRAMGIVDLYLENLSESSISFSPNYDSKIYIKTSEGWDPVRNVFYYSEVEKILPTKKLLPPGLEAPVAPDLGHISLPITLRILIIGVMVDTGRSVGAYLDITLE